MPTAAPATRGDDGLLRLADAVQELEYRPLVVPRRIVEKVLQVVARREQIHLAVDQHHAHPGICLGRLDRIGQGLVHGGGQRILLFRSVDFNARDAVPVFP